jgi:hypothetical protein
MTLGAGKETVDRLFEECLVYVSLHTFLTVAVITGVFGGGKRGKQEERDQENRHEKFHQVKFHVSYCSKVSRAVKTKLEGLEKK